MSARRFTRLFLIAASLLVAKDVRPQLPFDLDTTFRAPIDTWYVSSIAPQPDGDVLLSGQIRFPADPIGTFRLLARVDASGQPIAGFPYGYGGGKLVEWNGRYYVLNNQIVRRVWPYGTTDTDFISMNLGPYFSSLQGGDYHVYPDGRVLMSGVHVLSDSIRGYEGLYCLCWFSNTGYLDTTAHHRNCSGSLDFFQALPNGKFIGSGSTGIWDGQPASNIIRFEADGELDTTFQANVWWGQAYGFLPLTDGRVYASGLFRITGISDTLNLVRFMPDGSLEPRSMWQVATQAAVPPASISVYPNPASAFATVEHHVSTPLKNGYLSFRDLTGREIHRRVLNSSLGQVLWDTRSLAPGVYSVELYNGTELLGSQRIVIKP